MTLDHIIPRAQGGVSEVDNLCLACSRCNGRKRDLRWCPSLAWMKGLRSVVSRLLIEPVATVRGHPIAQQFLPGPPLVRQTCRHSRGDGLPLLGGAGASGLLRLR